MAKAFRYQHLRSIVPNVAPSADELREGEIAVNLAPGVEKMFFKNAHNQVVKFITEDQVDTKTNTFSERINIISGATDVNTSSINDLNDKIAALAAGVNITLSVNPTVIYKGVATSVTLTGTMINGTPSEMKLMDGSTVLATSSSSPITKSVSLNITANSKTYKVIGTINGMTFEKEASVSARYPIYYGFAALASDLADVSNRYSPTTTAAHTYEKTCSVDGYHFHILVPSDISALSSFTMGGAPFVMNSSTETIGGITYKVYTSGYAYNNGTKLTVVAS